MEACYPDALISNTGELTLARGALFPRGGPVQNPILTLLRVERLLNPVFSCLAPLPDSPRLHTEYASNTEFNSSEGDADAGRPCEQLPHPPTRSVLFQGSNRFSNRVFFMGKTDF